MKINFETKSFQKNKFNEKIIQKYFNNASGAFKIAIQNKEPEVIFKFSYDALIKTGITLIAFYGYRIRSKKGHHIKILEKLSQILDNKDIMIIGDKMRKKRNLDLYEGGVIIGLKEVKQYLNFIKKVIQKAGEFIKNQKGLSLIH
jgi:hypothetical protein